MQQQPAVNVDETSWREEDHSCWLWAASTPEVVLFLLQASRSQQGVVALLGTDFMPGIISS
ncbi:MAG: transposase [Chloroflexi bacterium]|nr:transposase [Chloroflexota bacterium]